MGALLAGPPTPTYPTDSLRTTRALESNLLVPLVVVVIILIIIILIKFKFLSYGNGLLQASEDIAISDLEGLDPREEFVETFVDVGGELVKAVLKFVAFGLVEICNGKYIFKNLFLNLVFNRNVLQMADRTPSLWPY